ncbi:ABC transporter ATP-binding protein [Streptococcus merionis]|uniref:ABC transporter ATP-binding protein n=1 Tax=Streptococcus merionis TaxID=400065 RepID=UPI0026EF828B|nr:sn-glycerol-3-phosphate ABC transporter ATP-binding protein UgpC [Streptococcus merionis]
MSKIQFHHISKAYDHKLVIKDFNLDITKKEFVIFVGPSGCGKSTLLRMIAGLEEITDGELMIEDRIVNHLSPAERDIAMVFQNYALYPHMTVRDNIGYSLKIKGYSKEEIAKTVYKVVTILGLESYLDCKPGQLSGGQKQRVAMGRAMVRNPKVFLMDEPLSNLDAKLRGQMRVEIATLYQELDATFIYVTHDQTEAMTLGTRIVVLKDGVIQQIDTPYNLFHLPCNMFVASFIGSPPMNFIPVNISGTREQTLLLFDRASIDFSDYFFHFKGHQRAVLGIRANDILLTDPTSAENIFIGKIEAYEMLGDDSLVYVGVEQLTESLVVKVSSKDIYDVGQVVGIAFKLYKIHLFDVETEENLYSTKP